MTDNESISLFLRIILWLSDGSECRATGFVFERVAVSASENMKLQNVIAWFYEAIAHRGHKYYYFVCRG